MSSSLKKRINDLEISSKKRRDFDPEDESYAAKGNESDSNGSEDDDQSLGREHYESVSESKLRKPEKLELDSKRYGGKVVSRAALSGDDFQDERDPFAPEDDEDEDPFATKQGTGDASSDDENGVGLSGLDGELASDDEIDSDEAFEEGDEEKFRGKGFVFRGSGMSARTKPDDAAADILEAEQDISETNSDLSMNDVDDDEEDEDEDIQESDEDEDDEEDEEISDDGSDENELSAKPNPKSLLPKFGTDREKLKSLINSDTAAIASSLSQAAAADSKKGKAVKQQYQTFDRFLDARIKLQKGLMAANDLGSFQVVSDEEAQSAVQRAEEAALNLFSTIESIRHGILESNATNSSKTGKRKRPSAPTRSTSTNTLYDRIDSLETESSESRRMILDKWSTKTRMAAAAAPTLGGNLKASKLNQSSAESQSKLSNVIDTYLATSSEKLVSESLIPTSLSASDNDRSAEKQEQDENTISLPQFQDTIFYQSLLRDLISTRTHLLDPSSSLSNSSSTAVVIPTKLHPSGPTSAILRNKKIDTKASKGRKIRYTVHEKLENFMAGQGRTTNGEDGGRGASWSDAAVREFFGSLMGNRNMLLEEENNNDDDYKDDEEGEGEEDGEGTQREKEALRLFRSN